MQLRGRLLSPPRVAPCYGRHRSAPDLSPATQRGVAALLLVVTCRPRYSAVLLSPIPHFPHPTFCMPFSTQPSPAQQAGSPAASKQVQLCRPRSPTHPLPWPAKSTSLATPTSVSFALRCASRRMLPGLTSRCTTHGTQPWRYARAVAHCAARAGTQPASSRHHDMLRDWRCCIVHDVAPHTSIQYTHLPLVMTHTLRAMTHTYFESKSGTVALLSALPPPPSAVQLPPTAAGHQPCPAPRRAPGTWRVCAPATSVAAACCWQAPRCTRPGSLQAAPVGECIRCLRFGGCARI